MYSRSESSWRDVFEGVEGGSLAEVGDALSRKDYGQRDRAGVYFYWKII